MLMRRNVAAGIGSNEQMEYCKAALQRYDRKEPRYKWPTSLYFMNQLKQIEMTDCMELLTFLMYCIRLYQNIVLDTTLYQINRKLNLTLSMTTTYVYK